ncbi:MAG: hypothetical protein NWR72_21870 [Bacteroidia bacterium]|nr:hypothetical protein [Bacteroidia bacterium]
MTILIVVGLLGAGGYFAWWAIQRTLTDDAGKGRRARRSGRKK